MLCEAKQIGSLTQQHYATLERGKIYELLGDYNRAEKEYQKEEERPGLRRDYLVALYQKRDNRKKSKPLNRSCANVRNLMNM